MLPLKLIILGDYWDVQIYRGRLYLWTMSGSLKVFKWDELIEDLCQKYPTEAIAITCAFKRGDYLYDNDFSIIFDDTQIKNLILAKFSNVNELTLHFSERDLNPYLYGEQDNPFKELQTDSEVYFNKMYALTDNALIRSTAHRSVKKYPISSRFEKLWDCNMLSMKSSKYGSIALSGGDDGLFEYEAGNSLLRSRNLRKVEPNIYQVSEMHSSFSDWTYSSIYSSSQISKSFIAVFNWEENRNINTRDDFDETNDFEWSSSRFKKGRRLKTLYYDNEIFNSEDSGSLSWGCGDKIYRAKDNYIEIAKFMQYKTNESTDKEEIFDYIDKIYLQAWKGRIISAGISFFGSIIECENAIVVLKSDGDFTNIPGQATRWRVYPRSRRYENHLHIIFDDRLAIYSFNQDYFVNQYDKKYGIFYKKKGSR